MTKRESRKFNPLDKRNLGMNVAQALLRQTAVPIENVDDFKGAGVYAIYYSGGFAAYEALARRNRGGRFEAPIYVGRALPKGTRKGAELEASPGYVLYRRLAEHMKSLQQATNLDSGDFHCRYLVVDDIWISLGEALLIAKFTPVWNKLVDGFGNHDPGRGRAQGLRSRWDVLHPGRPWVEKLQPRSESADDIARGVETFLRDHPPPDDPLEF